MSLLKGLNKGVTAPTQERDSVGGGSRIIDGGVYGATITMAYLQKSQLKNYNGVQSGGALGVHLTFMTDTGKEVRQSIYITSGVDKGEKPTYTDKKTGEEHYLPGYLLVNSLTCLTIGKELHEELDEELKAVPIYNFEAKADVPTKVPVLLELIGQKVKIGVAKNLFTKKKLDGNVYVPTGEDGEQNEVIKFFRYEDDMTTGEILEGKTEAKFVNDFKAKYEGQLIDKRDKPPAGAPAGTPAPGAKPPAAKPASSLFKRPSSPAATTEPDQA